MRTLDEECKARTQCFTFFTMSDAQMLAANRLFSVDRGCVSNALCICFSFGSFLVCEQSAKRRWKCRCQANLYTHIPANGRYRNHGWLRSNDVDRLDRFHCSQTSKVYDYPLSACTARRFACIFLEGRLRIENVQRNILEF